MADTLLNELRSAIRSLNKPLLVCGAGVSVQATGGKAPSWSKLIRSGVQRAVQIGAATETWMNYSYERLNGSGDAAFIQVADELTAYLGGRNNAEYANWIKEELSGLIIEKSDLLQEIANLGCPIATTNYDDILADFTGYPVIQWQDYDETARFLKGEYGGILHLHGHWRCPGQVVLGSKSYDDYNEDGRKSILNKFAGLSRPTVFIGCSQEGLSDPDFARFNTFIKEWKGVVERRYWLLRTSDGPRIPVQHDQRLFPIYYGDEFNELVPFFIGT